MRVNSTGPAVHLGYCTNIHAGDTWTDVFPTLREQIPRVRSELNLEKELGIGLRLSNASAITLTNDDVFDEFKNWLDSENLYVYTINGFPYGLFHGGRVKEDVYKPDWTEPDRLRYTCQLVDLLSKLEPPDNYGSISTLPGTYKDWLMPGSEELIGQNLIKAVAHCFQIQQTTGVTVALALEPEPCCLLETTSETINFFERFLFSQTAIEQLMSLCHIERSTAELAMRTHIGVCYDVCHSAVEFEDPVSVITRLRTAGIEIIKIQLSSALEINAVNEASLRQLAHFDEPVYLHQVVEQRGELMTRYNDVGSAMAAFRHQLDARSTLHPALKIAINAQPTFHAFAEEEPEATWRVHFHVPVFMEKTEHFNTTQASLESVLRLQRQFSLSRHLEIETYTWDVLPERYRQRSVSSAIATEINWIRQRL
ncbi:MAG: metabolite traffic protein EboE [Granulosicoccus sp.]|nr:metabolite traffic protein EboE [Granulosicoccus sp.]